MSINRVECKQQIACAGEGNKDRAEDWFIERRTSVDDSEAVQLNEAGEFLSLAKEYEILSSYKEKLEFYEANPLYFEFPFCIFTLINESKSIFTFDFLPNLKVPEEVSIYNAWFIIHSKALLKTHKVELRGLPIIDGPELLRLFDSKKNRIHLLDEFVEYESERVMTLCDQAAPNRFKTLYSLLARAVQIDFSTNILDPRLWQDLFIWPYVNYIYELKRYRHAITVEQQQKVIEAYQEIQSYTKKSKVQKLRPKKRDHTILELFKHDEHKLKSFIKILQARGYLTNEGKWNTQIPSGEFLPIVDFLEKYVIRKASKAMLWRIFELEFGPIMSIRNFGVTNHQFNLDEALETALNSLKAEKHKF